MCTFQCFTRRTQAANACRSQAGPWLQNEAAAGNSKKATEIATYVLAGLSLVVLLVTLLMLRRIKIAVAILKVAANAIGTMPSITFFPVLTFLLFVGLFIYWLFVFAYQWSAGAVVAVRDPERESGPLFSLTWMYDPDGANSSVATGDAVGAAPPEATNSSALPCYDDSNCYYDVVLSKEQQVCIYAYVHWYGCVLV